ncbi:MAG TPA: ABC transporter ATP-binding protein [Anaerolineales bacterium]|nr:ABC transporter ATP-binding protein [Anaerolineales bacterium]
MSAKPTSKLSTQQTDSKQGPLLQVQDLQVEYITQRGRVKAVDGVSFEIGYHEVFGLAGESGCGKSTIAHAVTRILKPPAYITGGKVIFEDRDLLSLTPDELRSFRWEHLSIVFQSAMDSLNPVLTIGEQIVDVLQAHLIPDKAQARQRALKLLTWVGIDPKRIDNYPHQLSGGMRQRAVIALALALIPQMIILDEPTTALDVVVQKQIIQKIRQLQQELEFSVLFITHDLSLLVEFSDRIGIMYAGKLVEVAPAREIFTAPRHPYTRKLMTAFPTVLGPRRELSGIPGSPPNLISPPTGCRFHPRCDVMLGRVCQEDLPELIHINPDHQVACHLVEREMKS